MPEEPEELDITKVDLSKAVSISISSGPVDKLVQEGHLRVLRMLLKFCRYWDNFIWARWANRMGLALSAAADIVWGLTNKSIFDVFFNCFDIAICIWIFYSNEHCIAACIPAADNLADAKPTLADLKSFRMVIQRRRWFVWIGGFVILISEPVLNHDWGHLYVWMTNIGFIAWITALHFATIIAGPRRKAKEKIPFMSRLFPKLIPNPVRA